GDQRTPRAAGDDDAIGLHAAAVGLDATHAAPRDGDAGHAGEGLDLRPPLARAVGVAPEEGPGKDDAVVGIPRGGDEAALIEAGHDLARLARGDHARGEAVALLQRGAVLDALERLVVVREEEVAALAQPDVDAELL